MCVSNKIGLCAQNMITTLGSTVNINGGAFYDHLIQQNGDFKCHIIECRSRIKEGVLNQRIRSRKMCRNVEDVV